MVATDVTYRAGGIASFDYSPTKSSARARVTASPRISRISHECQLLRRRENISSRGEAYDTMRMICSGERDKKS